MKHFILIAAVAAFATPDADACDRARSRAVSRTVTTVKAPAPTVVVAAPPVVTTVRTVDRVRGREVVRGVVAAPARVVRGALEVLPCPNCR